MGKFCFTAKTMGRAHSAFVGQPKIGGEVGWGGAWELDDPAHAGLHSKTAIGWKTASNFGMRRDGSGGRDFLVIGRSKRIMGAKAVGRRSFYRTFPAGAGKRGQ